MTCGFCFQQCCGLQCEMIPACGMALGILFTAILLFGTKIIIDIVLPNQFEKKEARNGNK